MPVVVLWVEEERIRQGTLADWWPRLVCRSRIEVLVGGDEDIGIVQRRRWRQLGRALPDVGDPDCEHQETLLLLLLHMNVVWNHVHEIGKSDRRGKLTRTLRNGLGEDRCHIGRRKDGC